MEIRSQLYGGLNGLTVYSVDKVAHAVSGMGIFIIRDLQMDVLLMDTGG